jgi:cell division protein FtsL
MSNVDISDEFTKLIVTQQAYSASTRVVSVSDEMMQEALGWSARALHEAAGFRVGAAQWVSTVH